MTPTVIQDADGSTVIRIPPAPTPTDDLVRFPFGLERVAARRLMDQGKLPWVKIGRYRYTRRSHLLALVPDVGVMAEELPANDDSAEAIVERMARKARGG